MKISTRIHSIESTLLPLVAALIAVIMTIAGPAVAQTDADALRERIQTRIEADAAAGTQERAQLREHLREFLAAGLDEADLDALFPEGQPLAAQLRHQERVRTMLNEGLPVEPLLDKIQEGRRKNAPDRAIERVCNQLEQHVRTADRLMRQAREAGVQASGPAVETRLTESVARNMWRGLKSEDFEALMERSRDRLRDGSCSTTDLAAAAATATDMMEVGATRERAVEVAGQALRNAYAAGEIRQLAHMVMAAHAHGRSVDEAIGHMGDGMRNAEPMAAMVRSMARQGWMGPGDEHGGRGGHSPVDDVIGGPGGRTGGGNDGDRGGHGSGGGNGN